MRRNKGTSNNITFGEFPAGRTDEETNAILSAPGVLAIPIPPGEGTNADPKKGRPLVGQIPLSAAGAFIKSSAFSCLFLESHRALLNPFQQTDIKAALKQLKLAQYSKNWPEKRGAFIRDLLTNLGSKDIPPIDGEVCENPATDPVNKNQRKTIEIATDVAKKSDAKTPLFLSYCSKCHTDDTYKQLPLKDITSIPKEDKEIRRSILDRLCAKDPDLAMPPKEEMKPKPLELQQMIDQISDGAGCP